MSGPGLEPALLASVALVVAFLVLLRAARGSFWRIALVSLPGTLAHEAAHYLVGLILLAQPTGFSLWPRRQANAWVLGSVAFRNARFWNAAFVAFAPLLLLPLAWLGTVHGLLPLYRAGEWGWWLVAGYCVATLVFASLPSMQDLRMGALSALFYLSIAIAAWLALG